MTSTGYRALLERIETLRGLDSAALEELLMKPPPLLLMLSGTAAPVPPPADRMGYDQRK